MICHVICGSDCRDIPMKTAQNVEGLTAPRWFESRSLRHLWKLRSRGLSLPHSSRNRSRNTSVPGTPPKRTAGRASRYGVTVGTPSDYGAGGAGVASPYAVRSGSGTGTA